jgi:hypothetical protein
LKKEVLICLNNPIYTIEPIFLKIDLRTHFLFFNQFLIVHKTFKLSPLTSIYDLMFSGERSRQTLFSYQLRHISFSWSCIFFMYCWGEKRASFLRLHSFGFWRSLNFYVISTHTYILTHHKLTHKLTHTTTL